MGIKEISSHEDAAKTKEQVMEIVGIKEFSPKLAAEMAQQVEKDEELAPGSGAKLTEAIETLLKEIEKDVDSLVDKAPFWPRVQRWSRKALGYAMLGLGRGLGWTLLPITKLVNYLVFLVLRGGRLLVGTLPLPERQGRPASDPTLTKAFGRRIAVFGKETITTPEQAARERFLSSLRPNETLVVKHLDDDLQQLLQDEWDRNPVRVFGDRLRPLVAEQGSRTKARQIEPSESVPGASS